MEAGSPGLVERLGETIPSDVICRDETGSEVRFVTLVDRPTILSLVYYSCEHVCPQVLVALGRLVSDPPLGPWSGYRVITLSFDPADTSREAAEAKRNYTRPLPSGFPPDAWRFLTASGDNIARLTDRLGFRFKQDEHGFVHPSVLVILGPGGRISRYIHVSRYAYGAGTRVTFAAASLAESLRKAAAGVVEARPPEPVLFCFPHEPPSQAKFSEIMTFSGWVTLAVLAALFVYLAAGRGKRRPIGGDE